MQDMNEELRGRYLTDQQAAIYLNLSVHTLRKWRQHGGGPPVVRFGRSVRYQRDDLDRFANERKAAS